MTNGVQVVSDIVRVNHFKLDVLVPLKVKAEEEALLEVRVEIVFHHLGLVYLFPPSLWTVTHIYDAHRVGHTDDVDILKLATRDKQLHLATVWVGLRGHRRVDGGDVGLLVLTTWDLLILHLFI